MDQGAVLELYMTECLSDGRGERRGMDEGAGLEPRFTLVSVESPYDARNPWTLLRNIQYAVLCNAAEASHKHATWAPHLCNTQTVFMGLRMFFGDATIALLLGLGLFAASPAAKFSIGRAETLRVTNEARSTNCDAVAVYVDLGITDGMQAAIDAAKAAGKPVLERKLPDDVMKHVFGQSFGSTAVPIATDAVVVSSVGFSAAKLCRWAVPVLRRALRK